MDREYLQALSVILKPPTFSISAFSVALNKKGVSPEDIVDAWIKRYSVKGTHKEYVKLVKDNYDFYCCFVDLCASGAYKPYKAALRIWGT